MIARMEERFMAEALELAARGRGRVSPNPMVGAVLVRNGRIAGRGWHRCFGGPHAEVEAIRDAGSRARSATLYVTMEPCCFQGKTPACTGVVVPAGIRRVVAATLDPNPRVNGKGMRFLRAQGIATSVGLLGKEARRLNEAYFTFLRKKRPFVVLKVACTLDGMVADQQGRSRWITGPQAREYGHELRFGADAMVVGVGTVIADDPSLTCRVRGGKDLVRVVLDSELRTPPDCRLLAGRGSVLVFTASRDSARRRTLEQRGAVVVRVGRRKDGLLSLKHVLAELYRRKLMTVLVEGGATVASSVLDQGIADKAYVFSAPSVMGPGKLFSQGMRPRQLDAAIRLKDVRHVCLGPDILTEGYVYRTG